MTIFLLTRLSTPVVGVVVVGTSIVLSVVLLLIIRRLAPHRRTNDEYIKLLFGVLGGMYGIVLAFVVFVVWQSQATATANVFEEASQIEVLYQDASGFPEPVRGQLQGLIARYAHLVVDEEWDLLATRQSSPRAAAALRELAAQYARGEPQSEPERALYTAARSQIRELLGSRRARLLSSTVELPSTLWVMLLVGYAIVVGLVGSFAVEKVGMHVVAAALTSGMIGLLLFLIVVLNHPFSGEVRVSPEPIQQVIQSMETAPER